MRIDSAGTSWTYTDADGNAGQNDGPWESASTFGTADGTEDFKSAEYATLAKSTVLIAYNGDVLLHTDGSCFPGLSMQATFNGLAFAAGGSQSFSASDAGHKCAIAAQTSIVDGYLATSASGLTQLGFKFGEYEGAQDHNKDRVMLSTNHRSSVDHPMGLGSYSNIRGVEKSNNVGIYSDASISPGSGHVYSIYVA